MDPMMQTLLWFPTADPTVERQVAIPTGGFGLVMVCMAEVRQAATVITYLNETDT